MELTLYSLLLISLVALVAPVISFLIPHRLIPEAVLLVMGGMLLGPFGFNLIPEITHHSPLQLLSELGVAFLFLLAGYELDPAQMHGRTAAGAVAGWILSILLAFGAVLAHGLITSGSIDALLANNKDWTESLAIAIAMSATALGTLLPILKDRGLLETPTGHSVMAHGAMGELGPILMMALLLSLHNTWSSVLILTFFLLVALILARIPNRVQQAGLRLTRLIHFGSQTTAQTTVRLSVVLLVGLITLAASLGLDVVLGAFAAGFIVRQAIPDGRRELEEKLDGLAFGFFIPIFFVISGSKIDFWVVVRSPLSLLVLLVFLLTVRGLPVMTTLSFKIFNPQNQLLPLRERAMVGLYCTTNLPIIVAVTQIAVNSQAMSEHSASLLITAGVASVLIMPLLAQIVQHLPGRGRYRLHKQIIENRRRTKKNSRP